MARSKILATYDSEAMFAVEDAAIKAGPEGHMMTFANAKNANNFMLDFYGFRNAIWVAIERHKREDLRATLTRISRIKCSKQGNTLIFVDRTAMTGYTPTRQEVFEPPSAIPVRETMLEPADEILKKFGFALGSGGLFTEATTPESNTPAVTDSNPPEAA